MADWLGRWLRPRRPEEAAPDVAAEAVARARLPRLPRDRTLRRAAADWPGQGQPIAVAAPRLAHCRSWVMQLQAINWERIEASIADIAVIDASADGSPAGTFPPGVIDRMRTKPGGGDSVVLCHLSIGAAEPWRGYWQPKWRRARPGFIDAAPGDWGGTQRVQFWDPRWQEIILGGAGSLLAGIVSAGFDGVVLGGIDSYQHFAAKGRRSAPDEMIDLVARIGTAAWAANPNFLIVPLNGEELVASPRYRSVISALIVEDTLYRRELGAGDGALLEGSDQDIRDVLDDLAPAIAEQLPILAVEYLRDDAALAGRIPQAAQRLRRLGFLPYIAPQRLDRLCAPEV